MSRVFENAPNGLNYDVYGGAVPNSMLYRIKQIEGLSKQTLTIVPTSGQGSVYNGNKIIVSLPLACGVVVVALLIAVPELCRVGGCCLNCAIA